MTAVMAPRAPRGQSAERSVFIIYQRRQEQINDVIRAAQALREQL